MVIMEKKDGLNPLLYIPYSEIKGRLARIMCSLQCKPEPVLYSLQFRTFSSPIRKPTLTSNPLL